MSSSEPSVNAAEVAAGLEKLANHGEKYQLSSETIRGIVSSATRIYAKAVETAGAEFEPLQSKISTTEAMVMACALLRSQNLTPFDLALWFSHTAPRTGEAPAEDRSKS